ncbi:inorganic phosphate transporter [Schizosaccharomyces octosporus yFS286]|uniref:Inorganic phosphate transporter n=1 Tax=Schizosaccharomyces octosporus (strain yFS286) TaxID=483514 RepID=S9REL3_SCHOY|nr:inorganic phosphate transporter [Schizosaccharomyces octosporus yFS286]EPX72514.1 inorganic phosphate transporter [Schizosaccharomyces octosporus yFS286]
MSNVAAPIIPEKKGLQLYSPEYYGLCSLGGLLACGITHTAITPLDVVKCRRQVNPNVYPSNVAGLRSLFGKEGMRGLFTGGVPTFLGYSLQGLGKYGFYEVFKTQYSKIVGSENAHTYRTGVYLAASASAELLADVMLCPMEALKVRVQTTTPRFANTTREAWSKVVSSEGFGTLYRGLTPLWFRQIPYTMMKFASFEKIVESLYNYIGKPKNQYSKGEKIGISFAGGYMAGVLCAIISHPADTMVSKLNSSKQPGEGVGAAASRIYKNIGFGGLWNGLGMRIVMIGTLTGAQWLIYDSFKIACGFPATGA